MFFRSWVFLIADTLILSKHYVYKHNFAKSKYLLSVKDRVGVWRRVADGETRDGKIKASVFVSPNSDWEPLTWDAAQRNRKKI